MSRASEVELIDYLQGCQHEWFQVLPISVTKKKSASRMRSHHIDAERIHE